MHRLYASTMLFYIGDLSVQGFWHLWGRNFFKQIPLEYPGTIASHGADYCGFNVSWNWVESSIFLFLIFWLFEVLRIYVEILESI